MKTTQTWKIGDCLELLPEIPDKSIDLILTDPPYGINVVNEQNNRANKQYGAALAPSKKYDCLVWDTSKLTQNYFEEMIRISKNQIIFGGNYYTDYLIPSACWIVWDKNNGNNKYADCELIWTSFNGAVRKYTHTWNGMLQEDMSHKEIRVHPTQKPLKLIEWIIKKYSKEEDVICDPFLGSGTTLEACKNTNRTCIGFEISHDWEEHYRTRLKLDNTKLDAWADRVLVGCE